MLIHQVKRLQPFIKRTHSMDPADLRWLAARGYDLDWETDGGRDDLEEPWNWAFPAVLQDIGDNEDTGDDKRRRERMAEACYEC